MAKARNSSVRFSSSCHRGVPCVAGVPHNGELPYVIGFPFYQESRVLRRDAQIVDVVRWDDEDQIWTLYMMEMWTNFAKFGCDSCGTRTFLPTFPLRFPTDSRQRSVTIANISSKLDTIRSQLGGYLIFRNPTPSPVRAPDGSNTTWPIWNNGSQEYLHLDRHMEYRCEGVDCLSTERLSVFLGVC